jgi:hypothetical protein
MKACSAGLPKLLKIKVNTPSGLVIRELDDMGRLKERSRPGTRPSRAIPQTGPEFAPKPSSSMIPRKSFTQLPPPMMFPDSLPTPADFVSLTEFVTIDQDFLEKLEPIRPFDWDSWDSRSDRYLWLS